jgi:hypothetical protein
MNFLLSKNLKFTEALISNDLCDFLVYLQLKRVKYRTSVFKVNYFYVIWKIDESKNLEQMNKKCTFASRMELGGLSEWFKEHAWKVCIRQKCIKSSNLLASAGSLLVTCYSLAVSVQHSNE